jgi:hypothetical protein
MGLRARLLRAVAAGGLAVVTLPGCAEVSENPKTSIGLLGGAALGGLIAGAAGAGGAGNRGWPHRRRSPGRTLRQPARRAGPPACGSGGTSGPGDGAEWDGCSLEESRQRAHGHRHPGPHVSGAKWRLLPRIRDDGHDRRPAGARLRHGVPSAGRQLARRELDGDEMQGRRREREMSDNPESPRASASPRAVRRRGCSALGKLFRGARMQCESPTPCLDAPSGRRSSSPWCWRPGRCRRLARNTYDHEASLRGR